MKRLRTLIPLLSTVLALGAVGAAVKACRAARSGERLFQRFVADPVPGSVTVLDGSLWAGIGDGGVFVMFEIAQGDLADLIEAGGYRAYARGIEGVWAKSYLGVLEGSWGAAIEMSRPFDHYRAGSGIHRRNLLCTATGEVRRVCFWSG